jgi:hypothetical protein
MSTTNPTFTKSDFPPVPCIVCELIELHPEHGPDAQFCPDCGDGPYCDGCADSRLVTDGRCEYCHGRAADKAAIESRFMGPR